MTDLPDASGPQHPHPARGTTDGDGEAHVLPGDADTHPRPLEPWKPMKIRMFVDDVSGTGLWPDWAWAYPGSPFEYLFDDEPENVLPISEQLRDDIRSWVDEYTASFDEPRTPFGWAEHDLRGHRLSERLQTELNSDDFRVQYKPHSKTTRQ